ncbi:phosphate transporter [Klebsormidium nitens]|uniref:Phosphate transporter n=1 Tax=Klebsormidium nitens TaxID=105231 RepID=A0A0U9HRT0_KLENI|nr:phosphate transporter [Klebsormidium nitens]|eukprot:GAQ81972.1 phosphate transporter [Klebsormidium nitens]
MAARNGDFSEKDFHGPTGVTAAPASASAVAAEEYDYGDRPSKVYSSNPVIAGVLHFSIGNLSAIFAKEYPKCFGKTHPNCSYRLTNSTTYTQIAGIMAGMVFLGFFADRLGRKLGSIITASIMLVGGIMLTASDGPTQSGIVLMYTISQGPVCTFRTSRGPCADASTLQTSDRILGACVRCGSRWRIPHRLFFRGERAEADKNLINKRGETVILVFSNQGLGNVVNVCVLLFLLACFGQWGPTYDPTKLDWVWRLSFAFGLIPVMIMLYIRIFKLQESSIWTGEHLTSERCAARDSSAAVPFADASKRNNLKKEGLRVSFGGRKFLVLVYHYWHRLAGTALSWFVWDVAFYGNKLFQMALSWFVWDVVFYGNKLFKSTFINIIIGGSPSLIQTLEYTLLNSVIAYVGYFFAAFTIDRRWMGRTRMQIMGFAFIFVLFLLCSIYYDSLTSKKYIGVFEFLYFFSSFWGQASAHGIAAATGKAGALTAGIWFQHVDNQSKFTITTVCAGIGLALTILFVPDITGLDLREADARWVMLLEGKGREYQGPAVQWRNLSVWEWLVGYARQYNEKAPKVTLAHVPEKVHKGVTPEV